MNENYIIKNTFNIEDEQVAKTEIFLRQGPDRLNRVLSG